VIFLLSQPVLPVKQGITGNNYGNHYGDLACFAGGAGKKGLF
jgi:hypothetical protein